MCIDFSAGSLLVCEVTPPLESNSYQFNTTLVIVSIMLWTCHVQLSISKLNLSHVVCMFFLSLPKPHNVPALCPKPYHSPDVLRPTVCVSSCTKWRFARTHVSIGRGSHEQHIVDSHVLSGGGRRRDRLRHQSALGG
jgi:hypothetical protein